MNEHLSELENQEAEKLELALQALMKDEKLPQESASPELSAAIRMKTAQHAPELSHAVDRKLESLLLKKFAASKEEKSKWWQSLFVPAFTGSLVMAALALVLIFNYTGSTETEPLLASVQGFESLSEAEELLGDLPLSAITEDGLSVAELRQSIHEVNLIRSQADTTLDAGMEEFPHVQLRDTALDVIELEEAVEEELPGNLLAMVDLELETELFSEKVGGWPSTNQGVAYETHFKAVRTFVSHGEIWNKEMLELAQSIVSNLEN